MWAKGQSLKERRPLKDTSYALRGSLKPITWEKLQVIPDPGLAFDMSHVFPAVTLYNYINSLCQQFASWINLYKMSGECGFRLEIRLVEALELPLQRSVTQHIILIISTILLRDQSGVFMRLNIRGKKLVLLNQASSGNLFYLLFARKLVHQLFPYH